MLDLTIPTNLAFEQLRAHLFGMIDFYLLFCQRDACAAQPIYAESWKELREKVVLFRSHYTPKTINEKNILKTCPVSPNDVSVV